ncbi:MAG: DUF4249 family protein [Bacteroidetes bacterium]|nr:DUF4249 family protein [Bacteroidota bacterium]
MNLKRISTGILVFTLAGCDKEEQIAFTDSPVIEGYEHPGEVFSIKISRQVPFEEDVQYSADDLEALAISVHSALYGQTYSLTSIGGGVYVDSTLVVAAGDEYTLIFEYNGKAVSAYTYVPLPPQNFTQSVTSIQIEKIEIGSGPPAGGGGFSQPEPIEFKWDNTDESYYLIIVENIESDPEATVDFGDEEPPSFSFRKTPTSSNSEFIQAREFQYYGTHRIILYHVLPDYAALYDDSDNSSLNLTNASGSVTNGYGIFTGMNSDTLYVEVTD